MIDIGHATPPEQWLTDAPSPDEIERITRFLESQGTFRFPTVRTGLFSAAAGDDPEFRLTGYQNVWTRDNVHVAHALWATGDRAAAVRAVSALLTFYSRHRRRFVDILEDRVDPWSPMDRPHVRFDGETLKENPERWAHAQNDALGYLLWITCKLLRAGDLEPTPEMLDLFELLVKYFDAIEYWQDEDSGHWEETRKIEASSIGTVVAGLRELRDWQAEAEPAPALPPVESLIERGEAALDEILPAECIQPDPEKIRPYDAALLFLISPLGVVEDAMADQIIADVRTHLMGEHGIRRYIGDSYWCANYRDLLSAEVRTTDFSEDMSERDQLLNPGEEAQWCIFDPILSVIFGQRYQASGDKAAFEQQIRHLRRSLSQLTKDEPPFPDYRCPESYFLEQGRWVPNDITPLLWTQGNLKLALHAMHNSAAN
jgi:hypothetical protein